MFKSVKRFIIVLVITSIANTYSVFHQFFVFHILGLKALVYLFIWIFSFDPKMADVAVPYLQSARASNASIRSLNDRFLTYSEHVRSMKEQCKNLDKNLSVTQIKALENQIDEVQDIYESKKIQLEEELENLKADKNVIELKANKLEAQNTELSSK